jgi:hypothetical protein
MKKKSIALFFKISAGLLIHQMWKVVISECALKNIGNATKMNSQ